MKTAEELKALVAAMMETGDAAADNERDLSLALMQTSTLMAVIVEVIERLDVLIEHAEREEGHLRALRKRRSDEFATLEDE